MAHLSSVQPDMKGRSKTVKSVDSGDVNLGFFCLYQFVIFLVLSFIANIPNNFSNF